MAAGGRVVLLAVGWLTGWSTNSGRREETARGQRVMVAVQEVEEEMEEEEEVEVAVGKGDGGG